ncbi:MAG: hypothetical protein IJ072_07560, partial [Oscillospiraceae bacterium]|nr:hypothetical protein [Oscillospiraceae bacterium]
MIKRIDILRTLQRNYKASKERNSDELCSQLAHTEELFRTKVNEDCLRIEVNTQELGKLLPDYIRMLSEKSPLAAVALLGKGLPIDTMDVIG